MQDLCDDQLGDDAARARVTDEMRLVQDAQREALESVGVLSQGEGALLRRHYEDMAVRNDAERLSFELRVLRAAEEVSNLYALQLSHRTAEITADLRDEGVRRREVQHPAVANGLRDGQLRNCRLARAGRHRYDRVRVWSGESTVCVLRRGRPQQRHAVRAAALVGGEPAAVIIWRRQLSKSAPRRFVARRGEEDAQVVKVRVCGETR